MAKIRLHAKIILLLVVWTTSTAAWSRENNLDIDTSLDAPDPAALKAYKQYWDAFQEYETRTQRATIEEFERARDGIQSAYEAKDRAATEKRIELLNDGIGRYEKHLATMPSASNRSYVMLNLAQMLAELAALQHSIDSNAAGLSRQRALTLLKDVDDKYPDFSFRNDAMYQRALLLEANREKDAALAIWKKLAVSTKGDRYALHANLVSGDWEFSNADPEKALKYYDTAFALLSSLDTGDRSLDELRVQYRIGWAAYKATRHPRALEAAKALLSPGLSSKAVRQRDKIVRDAIDLVAFSLYELDDTAKSKSTISSPAFSRYGAAIALVMMTRYAGAGQHERVAQLASFAVDKFGAAKELPDVLLLGANANQSIKRPIARIDLLEKLAMLLPDESLWRTKYGSDGVLSQKLEEHATQAAVTVATWHYENGLSTSSAKSFNHAAGFFGMLVKKFPARKEAMDWRVRIANCHLYAGNLDEAEKSYNEMISVLKVNDDTLSIVMYQKTLAIEKLWRKKFESAIQRSADAVTDKAALSELQRLETAVNDHANRFPNQTRSIDLLLVAASANRDHNRFVEASRFWQRSLLASPTAAQRAMAIRGLVFAQLRAQKPAEVIDMVAKFLRLESTETLSQNLAAELKGVLSAATQEEGQRLAKAGDNESAGQLMVSIATEFKDIPNQEQISRDGAYMLAIGGNWPAAQDAAETYVKSGKTKYWGDMTYLIARSEEFQMRFAGAVKNYLSLAEKSQQHSRTQVAIERAEKLAAADEDFVSAARAMNLRADYSNDRKEKLAALSKACDYSIQANKLDQALVTAEKRKGASRNDDERIESELLLAKVRYSQGDKQTAVDDMDSIAKQIDRNRLKLGDRYAVLASQANAFLGDDLRAKFLEFRLADQSNTSKAVDDKSTLFTEMASRYDKVASLDQAEYSPKARFFLAQAANDFADELSGLPLRAGESTTLRTQTRFNQNVTRMREMAKRYHSNNLLAKQRAPQYYAQNEWIKKSALILSAAGDTAVRDAKEQTTSATHMEVPQQWSF